MIMKLYNRIFNFLAIGAAALAVSCSEDYLETAPTHTVDQETVNKVMQDDPSQVQAYVTGSMFNLYCGGDYWASHDDFGLPAVKLFTDLMCEDIAYTNDNHFFCYDYQMDNRMGNYRRTSSTWNQFYNLIDGCNTVITMLKPEDGAAVGDDVAIMLGQAYSTRALAYFWLINLWQHPYNVDPNALGVPVKNEVEYRANRVSVKEVYDQILGDAQAGYNYLEGKGYHSGDKTGLSEYAAAAIYANALMFVADYNKAAEYAKKAIAGGSLNASQLMGGFNSLAMDEVIWGYNVNEETTGYYASFFSHVDSYMIGYGGAVGFRKMISSELLDQIKDTDVRRGWFGYNPAYNLLDNSYAYEEAYGLTKYIANKYRDSYMTTMGGASPFTSAIIHTRIAEMYFVAAEAYYLAGDQAAALNMLNEIMVTRDPSYNCTATGDALYQEICLQKRIETWMEGCRYLDAKRRGETIDRSKSSNHSKSLPSFNAVTYSAHDYRMIYHIPEKEMQNNPEIEADNE